MRNLPFAFLPEETLAAVSQMTPSQVREDVAKPNAGWFRRMASFLMDPANFDGPYWLARSESALSAISER